MSNAGYGNHDAAKPSFAAAAVEGHKPATTETPRAKEPAAAPKHTGDRTSTLGDGASSRGGQGAEVDPGAG